VKVRVRGVLRSSIDEIARKAPEYADLVARKGAERTLELAQSEVPVDTGALKASGHIEGGGMTAGYFVVYDTPYATFVHYGTRKMRANPWLLRASERARPEFELMMRNAGAYLEGIQRYSEVTL
jgi:HK97 gp10 family phage protein